MLAQKWADNCEMRHESHKQRKIPGKYSVGKLGFLETGSKLVFIII